MPMIPGFHIKEKIYEGNKSVLYRGIREKDQLPVVIKSLSGEHPRLENVAKIRYEFEIYKNIASEGVIACHDLIEYGNNVALILEDFGGKSLGNIAREKKISAEFFFDTGIKIAETLHHLHNRKIIHRDIAPKNILVNPNTGQIKLIDFSISLVFDSENQEDSGMLEGTLTYISPEQTGRINRTVDHRTDFYALGGTFYEILCGFPPFQSDDSAELIYSHIARTPTPPHEKNADIPRPLSDIIMKLLAKSPEDRYQSGAGLAADLNRCRERLASGNIAPFPLGTSDVSETFRIPEKLYGRESAISVLEQAFERALSGGSELILVTGAAGMGKTELVREFHKNIFGKTCRFCSGKYEAEKQSIPYSGLIQALQELIRDLFLETEEQILLWKNRILKNLGEHAGIMTQMMPDLTLMIGKHPSPTSSDATETQFRINSAFAGLIKTFAGKDHPLVLFLDDVQRADPASLRLLAELLENTDALVCVAAYQEQDVNEAHLLSRFLTKIEALQITMNRIELPPLAVTSIMELLSDTLGRSPTEVKMLSGLLRRMTGGSPFFLKQALESFHAEGILVYDLSAAKWNWNEKQIQNAGLCDNVVDLTAEKIKKLSENTRRVLQYAACIGTRFDLNTLSAILESSESEILNPLREATQEGLITYKHPASAKRFSARISGFSAHFYGFRHDRFREVCYALLSEQEKQTVHFRIGRFLSENLSPDAPEENIFEIVKHLNKGQACAQSPEEQLELAKLNLVAGKHAKAAAAFDTALKYFTFGADSCDERLWEDHYDLAMEIAKNRSECEYFSGNFDNAEKWFDLVLARCRTDKERWEFFRYRIALYVTQGKNEQAAEAGLTVLERLGLPVPKNAADWAEAATKSLAEFREILTEHPISELLDAQMMCDPEKK